MSKQATFDPAKRLDLYFRCNRSGSKDFVFAYSDGTPYSFIYQEFTFNIYRSQGERKVLITLPLVYASNTLTTSITKALSNINEGEYYYELYNTNTEETWLCGDANFHNGKFDGVSTDSNALTVQINGETIAISVSAVSGSSNGVQSIVAGTNVSVDNTDPQNPVVSSTGGGGSTDLEFTIPNITMTGTYTLLSTDNGKEVILERNSPITLVLPVLTQGFNCTVRRRGSGTLTFSASGTTITTSSGDLTDSGENVIMAVSYESTTEVMVDNGTNPVATVPTLAQVLASGNDANALKITNLATPTNSSDAVTKSYADGLVAGVPTSRTINGQDLTQNRTIPHSILYRRDGQSRHYSNNLFTATPGTSVLALNTLRAYPWIVSKSLTFDTIDSTVSTLLNPSNFRIGIYTDDGNGYPASLVAGSDIQAYDGSTATNKLGTPASPITLSPGLYWIAINSNAAGPTLRAWPNVSIPHVLGLAAGAVGTTQSDQQVGWTVSQTFGAMSSTFPAGATALLSSAANCPIVKVRTT